MKPMLAVVLSLLLSCPALAQPKSDDQDAAIRAVVESFRTAILDKDRERFVALFIPGTVTWQSVRSDGRMREIRTRDPAATRLRINPASSHLSFIDEIVSEAARSEETFDNLRIESDGDIASVVFDYRFLANGRETNRGTEAWHLLRGDDGWRIASVIWSVNPPPSQQATLAHH